MKETEHTKFAEDDDLVYLSKKGDTDAFEELVRKYQKKMLNISFRMVNNYEEACDIVQDAFVSAYKNIRNFQERAKFSTWLSTIVINISKNRLKQLKSRHSHEQFSLDDPLHTNEGTIKVEYSSNEPSVIEKLEQKDLQQKVRDCVNSLEKDFKEVLILRDMQGFSYDEISDMLKIAAGTVKSRLFRARDSLKNCLKNVLGEL